ncbi:MAG: molybdopterin-guanine dinucleotide biosynthesis protein B [Desulfobacterales bacterium]|nr:molybdopterin-guanine dinucleotide biosynthesis protein B [Desulfobacterales bacterium]MBF0396318.1 molybdopterin-guanine dinucleotide biosynthesis protein B [Desulfobacterales bacterium]
MKPLIISVVGKSKVGKTTLIEKIICEFKNRKYKVGSVKHTYHDINIDWDGKDSSKHKNAGAEVVIVASPNKLFMIKDGNFESIENIICYFQGMDIVFVEGYKKENIPKIVVLNIEDKNYGKEFDEVIAFFDNSSQDINYLFDLIEKNIYEYRQRKSF